MTTIHGQLLGDQVLLSRHQLEQLIQLANRSEKVDLQLEEDELPTADLMRLAEQSGSFDFWNDEGEDIYSKTDGEPV